MNIKASVFIATSLEGFIARENGDLDWLTGAESTSSEQDYGYQVFIDTVDSVVMSRNTFELALSRVFGLSKGKSKSLRADSNR